MLCVVLVAACAVAPGTASAQSPIDVPTLVTVAPQEEAPAAGAPRSSFDYEAHTAMTVPPWEQPAPSRAQGDALAAAEKPSRLSAFVGTAEPLACRQAGYRVIIDDRGDLKSGTLCFLPDGSWQLLP